MTDPQLRRNARIDFLRGIAIGSVLLLHFALAYGLKNSPLSLLFSTDALRAIAYNGNFGVTIFFVISGFLITRMSLERWGSLAAIEWRTFYLYRFARIMPSLALALAIIVGLGSLGLPFFNNGDGAKLLPSSFFVLAVGSVLTFWHNVLMQSTGYFNYCLNVYWSLSVEEMFYLLLPLACLLLRRTWLIVVLCLGAIVLGPLYRSAHTENEIFFMYGYQACFDAIAIGCLTALLAAQGPRLAASRPLRWLAALALAAVYLRGIDGHEVFGFTLIALCSAMILLTASVDAGRPGWSTGRATAAIRWAGRHSYEIYLFHIIVLAGMRNLLSKDTLSYAARLPWLLLFLALTALAAALVARYVAAPANAALRLRAPHKLAPAGLSA